MLAAVAQFIGWAYVICALIGAIVPGFNFHVIFAGDESAIEAHKAMAARIESRIAKSAQDKEKAE